VGDFLLGTLAALISLGAIGFGVFLYMIFTGKICIAHAL